MENGSEPVCLVSWASTLTSDLDQFKNEKQSTKSIAACSLEMDMMDDFLEMERLAALSEIKSEPKFAAFESASGEPSSDKPLIAELDSMTRRVAYLENMLQKSEAERAGLQNALDETVDALKAAQTRIVEAEIRHGELQSELTVAEHENGPE